MELDEIYKHVYKSRASLTYFVENILEIKLDIAQKIKLLKLTETKQGNIEFENKEEQDFLLSVYLFHYMIFNQYKNIVFCSERINKELIQKIHALIKKINKSNFCGLTYLERFCKKSFELNNSELSVLNLNETSCIGRSVNLAFVENNKKNKGLLKNLIPAVAPSPQSKLIIVDLKGEQGDSCKKLYEVIATNQGF